MDKIDIHAHVLPKEWPDMETYSGYKGWIQLKVNDDNQTGLMIKNGTSFRKVDSKTWSIKRRLLDMERTNVSMQVLSTVPAMFSYWAVDRDALYLHKHLNNHLTAVKNQFPDKFLAIGTVPLQNPFLAVEEIKRIKGELNLNGIMIGTHVNGHNLSDKMFDPVWKVCQDMNIPIFVHPWDMDMDGRMSKYWLPYLVGMPAATTTAILCLCFGGVFERFNNLKMCFAHGAGSFPFTYARADHSWNVYPEDMRVDEGRAPSFYLNKGTIYSDTLVHNEASLMMVKDVLGEDHVILGSDYPFKLGEEFPGKMIENSKIIPQIVKEKFYHKNCRNFFNI